MGEKRKGSAKYGTAVRRREEEKANSFSKEWEREDWIVL